MVYPTVLVLGPGGIKGFIELGALLYFEQQTQFLSQIKIIIGVSIGSMIGLLYTSGFTVSDIIEMALTMDFFKDIFSFSAINITKKMGLISNDKIKDKLSQKLT